MQTYFSKFKFIFLPSWLRRGADRLGGDLHSDSCVYRGIRTPISALRASKSGFTIIETLVSLSIFTASILAIVTLTPGGVQAINLSKNKITASYLAQEGIDLVRAYRDGGNNSNPNVDTITLLSTNTTCDNSTIGCYISHELSSGTITITACGQNNEQDCPYLRHFDTGGFGYGTDTGGPNSLFVRKIFIHKNNPPGSDFVVRSIVEWSQGGGPHTVEYQTNLTNWN